MLKKFILLALSTTIFLTSCTICQGYELDLFTLVTDVIDGDSFYVQGDEVRLADVSCPEWNEYGGPEATQALTTLIEGQYVYLDTDQKSGRDRYDRLVAVVYIVFNETHFVNVNYYMLVSGHADLTDYTNNEFDPYTWNFFERYAYAEPEPTEKDTIMGINETYQALQEDYNVLEEEYIALALSHYQLQSDYEELQNQYNDLESNYTFLQSRYVALQTEVDDLHSQLNNQTSIPGFHFLPISLGLVIMIFLGYRRFPIQNRT